MNSRLYNRNVLLTQNWKSSYPIDFALLFCFLGAPVNWLKRLVDSPYQVYGTHCYHSQVCCPSKINYVLVFVFACVSMSISMPRSMSASMYLSMSISVPMSMSISACLCYMSISMSLPLSTLCQCLCLWLYQCKCLCLCLKLRVIFFGPQHGFR